MIPNLSSSTSSCEAAMPRPHLTGLNVLSNPCTKLSVGVSSPSATLLGSPTPAICENCSMERVVVIWSRSCGHIGFFWLKVCQILALSADNMVSKKKSENCPLTCMLVTPPPSGQQADSC